jgi:superfamily II helicase
MRRESSETESQVSMNEQVCYSCGEIKSVESFSNTQRRRYGNEARCRECVSLSTL